MTTKTKKVVNVALWIGLTLIPVSAWSCFAYFAENGLNV